MPTGTEQKNGSTASPATAIWKQSCDAGFAGPN